MAKKTKKAQEPSKVAVLDKPVYKLPRQFTKQQRDFLHTNLVKYLGDYTDAFIQGEYILHLPKIVLPEGCDIDCSTMWMVRPAGNFLNKDGAPRFSSPDLPVFMTMGVNEYIIALTVHDVPTQPDGYILAQFLVQDYEILKPPYSDPPRVEIKDWNSELYLIDQDSATAIFMQYQNTPDFTDAGAFVRSQPTFTHIIDVGHQTNYAVAPDFSEENE